VRKIKEVFRLKFDMGLGDDGVVAHDPGGLRAIVNLPQIGYSM